MFRGQRKEKTGARKFLFGGKEKGGKQRIKREKNEEVRVRSGVDWTAVTAKTQA